MVELSFFEECKLEHSALHAESVWQGPVWMHSSIVKKTKKNIKEKFDLDGLFFQIEQILGFKVVLVQREKSFISLSIVYNPHDAFSLTIL